MSIRKGESESGKGGEEGGEAAGTFTFLLGSTPTQ